MPGVDICSLDMAGLICTRLPSSIWYWPVVMTRRNDSWSAKVTKPKPRERCVTASYGRSTWG